MVRGARWRVFNARRGGPDTAAKATEGERPVGERHIRTRWRAGTVCSAARSSASARSRRTRPPRSLKRGETRHHHVLILATARSAPPTVRPGRRAPRARRRDPLRWGGASTRRGSMPFVTTRRPSAGMERRRSARATAWLTAIVRSAESPTATSSAGDVRGIRVPGHDKRPAEPSRPAQPGQRATVAGGVAVHDVHALALHQPLDARAVAPTGGSREARAPAPRRA